ncbi:hypothetical protein QJS10_CPB18g02086 [Acorus calamus]|uniref:Uncharacterized protein n=1 Tax=Acorus calamus TaxID=4465 RepID=A0AAV9CR94_ACOCL|nr:hypothetical protein QJS10_CPB18g02086 [Acorus calamus]
MEGEYNVLFLSTFDVVLKMPITLYMTTGKAIIQRPSIKERHCKVVVDKPMAEDSKGGGTGAERFKMSYVVVISVPLILLKTILAIACHLIERYRGRNEAQSVPHYHGPPVPPPSQAQRPPTPP